LLAAAQVAIYPIGAEGLENRGMGDASGGPQGFTNPMDAQSGQLRSLAEAARNRNANHATMDLIASQTGGDALYNNNGIVEAIARVVDDGSHYYRIAYTPTDHDMHEGYRRIEVKLTQGQYLTSYRRGYYVEAPKKQPETRHDPLTQFMKPGMPDFTQILYKMFVQPSSSTSSPGIAGDNSQPLLRYTADFAVAIRDVQFEVTPDGTRHGDLEVELVAYSRQGHPMNWVTRHFDLSLTPKMYKYFVIEGIQLHEELDVPTSFGYLRSGIYDVNSNKAGTLEIPLHAVTLPALVAK
jgi:hypothetical protein